MTWWKRALGVEVPVSAPSVDPALQRQIQQNERAMMEVSRRMEASANDAYIRLASGVIDEVIRGRHK